MYVCPLPLHNQVPYASLWRVHRIDNKESEAIRVVGPSTQGHQLCKGGDPLLKQHMSGP